MESVLERSNNVLVDVKGGNNIMYLPLDKLTNRVAEEAPAASTVAHEPVSIATPPVKEIKTDVRASSRERDVRGR
jgi:membrane protease subunit HflK